MEFALSAASYLTPVADALVFINTNQVHSVWFPYAWTPTLHAARVSMIFQTNARRSPAPLSWGTYITGYLIMCWGGGIISHLFLGLPPPMLYSFGPSIIYLSMHLVMTLVFHMVPDLLNPPVLDTILWPLDALLRANAVTSTLGLFHFPMVHPEYQNSALTHMLIGAIVSCGGGLTAGTLNAWSSNWAFGTPPVLRVGAGWAGTLDIWGGALVALIYSSTTAHPAFMSLNRYITLFLSSSYVSVARKPHADLDFPPLSPLQAKALATTVLGLLFAARVIKTHWLTNDAVGATATSQPKITATPVVPATPSKKSKKKAQ